MRIKGRTLPAAGVGVAEHDDELGGDVAAVMVVLPGFGVLATAEFDGELRVQVETTADLVGCPGCAAVAVCHDRRLRLVRDLPAGGRPVVLCWSKRVWRCRQRACPQTTWSERTEVVRPKGVLTERARAQACRRVGQDAHSVAQVAADLGVDWPTIMRAVREFGQRILDAEWVDRAVTRLGVDETALLAATAGSHTQFVTGLVDLEPAGGGPARLLDVVAGRSGAVVSAWLTERGSQWCAGVQVAALDPFRGYDTALRTHLPGARAVLDCFHAVKLANTAVDTVRRRVQHETLSHRGRTGDALYGIRRVLLRGADNQTVTSLTRLLDGLAAGDDDQVANAYIAAQGLHHVYGATDLAQARDRLFASTAPAPTPTSRSCTAWLVPSAPGRTSCWPTSPPAGPATNPPKP